MKQHRLIAQLTEKDPSVNFVFCLDFKNKKVTVTAALVDVVDVERYANNISIYTQFDGWAFGLGLRAFMDYDDADLCSAILADYKDYKSGEVGRAS